MEGQGAVRLVRSTHAALRRFDILWVRIFPGKNQRGDRVSSEPAKFSVRWALNDRTVARTTNAYLHPHRLQPLEAVNRPGNRGGRLV